MRSPLFARKQSGGMFAIVNETLTTGDIFYVDSTTGTNAAGYGLNPDAPLASIDYAVGLCTADKNCMIFVMPKHTETVATDGGLAIDVDGVSIIGIGNGNGRPTISIGTLAAAAMIISADDVLLKNFDISIAIDAATDPIQISGADVEVCNCYISEASACEALDLISVAATGTRFKLHDLKIRGQNTGDGDALNAIHLNGCDDGEIYNIHAYNGDWSEGVIKNEGDEALNLYIHNCLLDTNAPEDLCVVMDANATGFIHDIWCSLNDNAANIDECLSIGKMRAFDPLLVVNADGEKGIEWPGTDSVDE